MVLALIFFGPGKLPEIGRSLGRAINEFKAASREITREYREEAAPAAVPARAGDQPEDAVPGEDEAEPGGRSGPQ